MSSWYSMLFGKTTNAILETPPPSVLESIPTYLNNAVELFFTQLTTLPSAIKHLWTHEPSRIITKTFFYTLKDIAPLLLIDSGIQFLYSYFEETPPLVSLYGCLYVALELVNLGVSIFAFRSLIKSNVTALCAPSALNQFEKTNPKTDTECTAKCKGSLILLNGAINETSAYYSNLMAIWALHKVPFVGYYLAEITSIYATGRYVAGLTSPRCRKHEHLQSEATLSLGLIYKFFDYLLWRGFQSSGTLMHASLEYLLCRELPFIASLPSPLLMRIINELPLLLTIAIAANQKKPLTIAVSKKGLVDPIEIYENISAAFFKGACSGLKTEVKKLLSGPPSSIPWAKIGNYLLRIVQHPHAVSARNFFLPQMFHNWHFFINEPMISPRWTAVQKQLLVILNTLEEKSRSNIVNIAQKSPAKAAALFQFLFGFPKPAAKIVLEIMGNDNYMSIVETLRRKLELSEAKKETSLANLGNLLPLRTLERERETEKKPILTITTAELPSPKIVPLLSNDTPAFIPVQPDVNKFFTKKTQPAAPVDPDKHLIKRYG